MHDRMDCFGNGAPCVDNDASGAKQLSVYNVSSVFEMEEMMSWFKVVVVLLGSISVLLTLAGCGLWEGTSTSEASPRRSRLALTAPLRMIGQSR